MEGKERGSQRKESPVSTTRRRNYLPIKSNLGAKNKKGGGVSAKKHFRHWRLANKKKEREMGTNTPGDTDEDRTGRSGHGLGVFLMMVLALFSSSFSWLQWRWRVTQQQSTNTPGAYTRGQHHHSMHRNLYHLSLINCRYPYTRLPTCLLTHMPCGVRAATTIVLSRAGRKETLHCCSFFPRGETGGFVSVGGMMISGAIHPSNPQ